MLTKQYLVVYLIALGVIGVLGTIYLLKNNSPVLPSQDTLFASTSTSLSQQSSSEKASEGSKNLEGKIKPVASTSQSTSSTKSVIKRTTSTFSASASPASSTATTTAFSEIVTPALPTYTHSTLLKYNGTNPNLPIYIAYEGKVYDVTAGKAYYESGGVYNFLAGTDGTSLLRTIGGDIIQRKYPVVGTFNGEE